MSDYSPEKIKYLEKMARQIREDLIEMFRRSGKGHVGGCLSVVEVLVALYFHIMEVDPENPEWPDRDRLVLSKGHAAATLYAVLAEKGFFPKDLLFSQFIKINGLLQEHADIRVPGVDMSSGSLGQGLSVGLGMSLATRVTGRDYKVYVVISDGEMQSGQIWEALMACACYKTDNLTTIMDYNRFQASESIDKEIRLEPIAKKIESFGWNVLEIDGRDMGQVVQALQKTRDNTISAPTFIIYHTIKGRGIFFMEGKIEWHSHEFSEEDYQRAKQALTESIPSEGENL